MNHSKTPLTASMFACIWFVSGCRSNQYSDAKLKSRFNSERAGLSQLLSLFKESGARVVYFDGKRMPAGGNGRNDSEIANLLSKNSYESIAKADDGHIDVRFAVVATILGPVRDYYFEYRPNLPTKTIDNLYFQNGYAEKGDDFIALGDDWHATKTEDH